MITALVTGAKGQLGSEIKSIASKYPQIHFIYSDVDTLDITKIGDINQFIDKHVVGKLDYIINCAAYTAVDKAEDEIELATLINETASSNLATICKERDTRLIHVSTDYVFDGTNHTPYTEDVPTSPQSVYGETKLAGEKVIQSTNPEYIILRTSWLYSSFGNNFVKTIQKLSSERDSLNVLYDQIGTPTYANDLAIAILDIIKTCDNGLPFHKGIYHYSNEGVCSWYDFAQQIVALSNHQCYLEPIRSYQFSQKAARPSYSVLDKAKIKSTFNISIPFWLDSLKDCIQTLREK